MARNLRSPAWEVEGRDWPLRETSRFIEAGGLRWHVQSSGEGPVVLLVHGTGASTHSFRDLIPILAREHRVIAPDLPGHGFTARPADDAGLSLPAMARALKALLETLAVRESIAIAVGHSAGAAILCRLCLDGDLRPQRLVSLNGALLPLPGFKHPAFTPLVRSVVASDWLPRWFARRLESPHEIERLLARTGSRLDARGLELYARLSRCSAHSGAALVMMGQWDPRPLEYELPSLRVPLRLIVGAEDRMILPGEATRVRRLVPQAQLIQVPGLGHLAHEEAPERIAELILRDGFTPTG